MSKQELVQLVPSHAVRTVQVKNGVPEVFWEPVRVNTSDPRVSVILNHGLPMNRTMRKYGITTPIRQASFLGNVIQESGWLRNLQESGGDPVPLEAFRW